MALATDINPGGGFSPSMPFVMTLACFGMGLTLEEALVARHDQRRGRRSTAPIASAASSRASRWTRCIVDGALADLVRVGAPVVQTVIKRGQVVHGTKNEKRRTKN